MTAIAMNCGQVVIDAQDGNQVETSSNENVIPPTEAQNFAASGISATSVVVVWEKNYGKIPVAYYEIQINGTGKPIAVDGESTSAQISDLSESTSYDLRIRSCDEKGNCSAYSPQLSITTLVLPDTKPPTVPTGLASPAKTMSSVTLSWTASSDSSGVALYNIQVNSSGTAATVNGSMTGATVGNLNASTAYSFRVQACDASNNCSAYSTSISITTLAAPDTTAPTVPTNLTSPSKTTTTVNLTWTASTDAVGVARYEVRTNSAGTPVPTTTNSRTMTGLTANTAYQFQVRACDASNNCSTYTSNISVTTMSDADTQAPTVPATLTPSNQTSSAITLNWTASTDNIGVNRYEIRTNGTGTPIVVMGSSTMRVMSGLTASTTYQFEVRACDAANNCSGYRSVSSATLAETTAPDVQGCSSTIRTFTNTASSRKTVPLCANVFNSPAKITLQWANIANFTRSSVKVFRRSVGETTWSTTAYATLPSASVNTWSDTSVSVGTKYEYRVQVNAGASNEANGYIVSGIRVPATSYQGKIILVVDNTFQTTLASEILTLQNDYRKKGWIPKTIYVARTASALSVKALIVNMYNLDPANTKAVFLLGHVPVPYSGLTQWPAGHSDHKGAWVADGYYGDTGAWTAGGGSVWYYAHGPNASSKFINDTFPSALEMAVGRVDMINLSGSRADPFGNIVMGFGRTETQLLSDYLNRLHNFKAGTVVPARKAIIDSDVDNDGYAVVPGSFSSFATSIDPNNIDQIAAGAEPNFIGQINNDNYLWAHATGYATGIGMISNGNILQSVTSNIGSVFNLSFGSYYGDFDAPLNFLRGLIANDTGHTSYALTHIYSGYKHLYAHPMAMGDSIGNAWKMSAKNTDANYNPYRVDAEDYWAGETYFSLMGDPTLTLFHPKAPGALQVNAGTGNFTLSWTAPSGGANGYYIYEIIENASSSAATESIVKIGTKITSTTSPTISGNPAGRKFMVRAIKDEVTASGTYENLSLGSTN